MIEAPKVGVQCWIITDFWEELYPLPVTIIAEKTKGIYLCRWHMNEECGEIYEDIEPREMFATEQAARDQIKLERRLQECREKQTKKPFI